MSWIGRSDQSSAASIATGPSCFIAISPSRESAAPRLIHRRKSAITSGGSLPSGGISSFLVNTNASISRLF